MIRRMFWKGEQMRNKKSIKVIVVIVAVLLPVLIIIGYHFLHRLFLQRDGFIGGERVQIEDVNYRYENFELTKEGKTIALIDDWIINEIPEDPSHTFFVVRSFLDQYYIVREDYEIPAKGNVSCAYIGSHNRTDDKKILQALTEILQKEYTNGIDFFISNENEANNGFRQITVGYEGCPVGTDSSIYYIGKMDSKWVIVFRDDLGEWKNNKLPAIYYELDEQYGEIFENSGFWE